MKSPLNKKSVTELGPNVPFSFRRTSAFDIDISNFDPAASQPWDTPWDDGRRDKAHGGDSKGEGTAIDNRVLP
jgi:hypothetical protein